MLRRLDLLRRDSPRESLDSIHSHADMAVAHDGAIRGPSDSLATSTTVLPALVWTICCVEDGEGFLAESDEIAMTCDSDEDSVDLMCILRLTRAVRAMLTFGAD